MDKILLEKAMFLCKPNFFDKKINLKKNLSSQNLSDNRYHTEQVKYEALALLFAKEIEQISDFILENKNLIFFCENNFFQQACQFKEKFQKLIVNVDVCNLQKSAANPSFKTQECFLPIFLDIKNTFEKIKSLSLSSKDCVAINVTDYKKNLFGNVSVNVDLEINILKNFSINERVVSFLDCVYFSVQTKIMLSEILDNEKQPIM